jgi:hypothetical protein
LGIWMILIFCLVLVMMLMVPLLAASLLFLLKVVNLIAFWEFSFYSWFDVCFCVSWCCWKHWGSAFFFFCLIVYAAYDTRNNGVALVQQRSPVVELLFFLSFYYFCTRMSLEVGLYVFWLSGSVSIHMLTWYPYLI